MLCIWLWYFNKHGAVKAMHACKDFARRKASADVLVLKEAEGKQVFGIKIGQWCCFMYRRRNRVARS